MSDLKADDAAVSGEAAHVSAEKPAALEIPSTLALTREQLTQLRAGNGHIEATITIKRAGTGKEETYNLILTPQSEA